VNTRIRLIHRDPLSCEPILRRAPDGSLLCVSQVGDVTEPAPGNRVHAFRSEDQGESWRDLGSVYPESGEAVKTDIPNPGNKPKLIPLPDGRVALIHTPNPAPGFDNRSPLSLWISGDDLKTFSDKRVVTDFPGNYCHPDGFYEDGHILFTIEINRHEILFFDCNV